jgi:nucleotide-binding universal stress UspA family protein
MYQRILIATDGSKLSAKAVREGVRLAKAIGAEVVGMICTPTFTVGALPAGLMTALPRQYLRQSDKAAAGALEVVQRAAAQAGVRCRTRQVKADRPHEAIVRQARRERCGLIVMASHGRSGISRALLGSETAKVLVHSTIPVLVCR